MKAWISIGVNLDEVKDALYKLEPRQQNQALKKALRETAKQAREKLVKQAQASYTVKNAGFKKAMTIRMVSGSIPAAKLHAEGEPLPLRSFKVSASGRTTRAQVLKRGRLKELKRGGIKAFVNNIARKGQTRKKSSRKGVAGSQVRHVAVAQRQGRKRLEIHEKFSNSIPAMLGSEEHVYGIVEPEIGVNLQDNLRKFIDQAMGG